MDTPRTRITAHERRRISVLAAVDPRTLDRFLSGKPIRSTCEARIRLALGLPAPASTIEAR